MAKWVTCRHCGQKIDREREEVVLLKNRCYAHKDCCEEGEGDILPPILNKDLINLYDYICKLFKFDKIPVRIKNQIKRYVEEEGFTYTGILATLKYWYEFQNGDISKANDGITIVTYIYDVAEKYYFSLYMAEQLNKNKEFKSPDVKNYTVKLEEEKDFIDWEVSDE